MKKTKKVFCLLILFLCLFMSIFFGWTYKNNVFNKNDFFVKQQKHDVHETNKIINEPATLDELQKLSYNEIANLKKFDGRKYNIVTPIKNQGQDGICWAFALASQSETNMLYQKNLLEPSYNNQNFILSPYSIDKVVNKRTGKEDPLGLTSQDIINKPLNQGATNLFIPGSILLQQNAPILEQNNLKVGWLNDVITIPNNVNEIKQAIAKYGALSFEYKKAPASSEAHFTDSTMFDHASTIIGWDDTYPKEHFHNNKVKNNGAWIVKNSWGENFHGKEKGYFYLSYESTISRLVALNFVNKPNYQNLYYYDGLGRIETRIEPSHKVAAIFPTKKANEKLEEIIEAISFGIIGKNIKVKMSIYDNVNANPNDIYSPENIPTSGKLIYEQVSEILPNPDDSIGSLYTIELNQDVSLNPHSFFSIVLEIVNPDNQKSFLFSYEKSNNDMTFEYSSKTKKWTNPMIEGYVACAKAITSVRSRNNETIDLRNTIINSEIKDYEYNPNNNYDIMIDVFYKDKKLTLNQDYQISTKINYFQASQQSNIVGEIILNIIPSNNQQVIGSNSIKLNIIKANNPPISFGNFQNNKIIINIDSSYENQINSFQQIQIGNNWKFKNKNLDLKPDIENENEIEYIGDDKTYYNNVNFVAIVNLKIIKIDLTNNQIVLEPITDYFYVGSEIKPPIFLNYKNNKLNLGIDFLTKYENCINVGSATIIVEGINYFKGNKIIKFNIKKSKNKIINFSVDDGKIIASSLFGDIEYQYSDDIEGKKWINGVPEKPGTYYVRLYVQGTNNYSEVISEVKRIVIKSPNRQIHNKNLILIVSTITSTSLVVIIVASLLYWRIKRKKS